MNEQTAPTTREAIVLLSGGLDSATVLAKACADGFQCRTMAFNYGQRHCAELDAAARIANHANVLEHRVVDIDLAVFGGSALTDDTLSVPQAPSEGIPITYVPARNTIFLSYALGLAEVTRARDIFIGVNAVDYSGYPDCRPDFVAAFETMANLATKAGTEGDSIRIGTPLINLSKGEIISLGLSLGVDYSQTVSCYQASDAGEACGQCDACRLRRDGFAAAGVADPTRYRQDAMLG
ncbi:MAG: 7-cyano-7-deazaguanine synthase QueC [Pseudomonadaceae bacterium]|nr:7-cyano-7-deazaguanine synthase QueC [Pseudomonadaceae bacterium]